MANREAKYEFQVGFLRRIQRLLAEGGFVATYKFALLHAIADLCIECDAADDGTLKLTVDQLAEKFIHLYWRQVQHYPIRGVADDLVLKQNTGKQAAVINALRELHPEYHNRLPRLKSDSREWKKAVKTVGGTIKVMPLWKLQTIGERTIEFMYSNNRGADHIVLKPGVAGCFRAFHGLIIELVRGAWIRYIRRHNDEVRQSLELYGFLFGSERANLDGYRMVLEYLEGKRCFYCSGSIRGDPHVDHFIPWSRYPNDLGHNLVLAHGKCNSRKSDYLAAEEHLENWIGRNMERGLELEEAFRKTGLDSDRDASVRVARWAYEELEKVEGEVWVREKELRRLGEGWKEVLSV